MGILGRLAAVLVILVPLGAAFAAGPSTSAPGEPPAKDYWIYFDTDSFRLRPDGLETLDVVVRAIKQLGRPKVILTGHADTAGSRASDIMLTKRRAEEAKAFLVKAGVPADDITTVAKGQSDLRVLTPRGVHSQENRNVHIELK